jgi:HAMP domain-containing protein
MTGQLAEQAAEIEELRGFVEGGKQDQKRLAAGKTEIEQLNQSVER